MDIYMKVRELLDRVERLEVQLKEILEGQDTVLLGEPAYDNDPPVGSWDIDSDPTPEEEQAIEFWGDQEAEG